MAKEGGSDDGNQPGPDVVTGLVDVESGDLDRGKDTIDDQGGGHEVLRNFARKIGASLTGNDDWGGDDCGGLGRRWSRVWLELNIPPANMESACWKPKTSASTMGMVSFNPKKGAARSVLLMKGRFGVKRNA